MIGVVLKAMSAVMYISRCQQDHLNSISLVVLTDYRRSVVMDKLTVISFLTFFIVDILIIVSVATPDWVVSDIGGT